MSASNDDFTRNTYLRMKELWRGRRFRPGETVAGSSPNEPSPYASGREPKALAAVLELATEEMGWQAELEQARLVSHWAELVGPVTAPHTQVIEVRNGQLIVQCDSTAWATELRLMRATILTRIAEQYPNAGITDLRFLQPGAPSWRYGSRVVRGQGPRDTYG